jgi:hypothetical protein
MEKCNYCFKYKELAAGKKYCIDCNCGRECKKCKKPKAAHLYTEDGITCKSCANRRGGSALKGAVTTTYIPFSTKTDMMIAFKEAEDEIVDRIKDKAEEFRGVKFYITMNIGFVKPIDEITTEAGFNTSVHTSLKESEVDISTLFQELYSKMENFCRESSGWVFTDVQDIILNMVIYNPLS